jgi:uridylate kinase
MTAATGNKLESKSDLKYRRILLKLSGEALKGDGDFGFNEDVVKRIAREIADTHRLGAQVAVVVGGGNIFRGELGRRWGMDKAAADYVGMLATIMNGLILQEFLTNQFDVETRVQTAIAMPSVAEPFIRLRAIRHLNKGRVVIFGGGTGNPHVTTDTAAALRAAEIKADAVLMAKNKVDGVYDKDPNKNKDARKIESISFDDYLRQGLKVMDPAGVSLAQQSNIPIIVFDFEKDGSIRKIVSGDDSIGTTVGR